ncbi:cation:proton antiporter [Luteibacter sp. CQ10]|uniref:cation:proton antiporter n=1 Tax=Luteibacter sp. CQ10 TaxID=2805821 RepID=UPI0034A3E16A
MGILGWIVFISVLLAVTSTAAGWIRRGPITSFAIYLVMGVVVGPAVLDLVRLDIADNASWLRGMTEAGLVVSLFITGLKLRLPLRHRAWFTSLRLAVPGMLLTIAGVTCLIHAFLGWPWPVALAIAAMLSPTDPVLSSLVSVDDARDDDAMRVALSGEAGLNDGTALPFLLLALTLLATPHMEHGAWLHWFTRDLVWEWVGGIGFGLAVGWLVGYGGTHLRHATQDVAPSDFLALGIMGLAYGGAELLHASGFLAAFAAGVGLRRVELTVTEQHSGSEKDGMADDSPAELLVRPNERSTADTKHPAHTVGWVVSDALSFGDTTERLIGGALVFVAGIAAWPSFSAAGVTVALALFFVIRPAAVWISTMGERLPWQRRLLLGWFGIRGLGSLNYLAFALTHGLSGNVGKTVAHAVLTVVALSILVHGVSTTPLMNWRGRALESRRERQSPERER